MRPKAYRKINSKVIVSALVVGHVVVDFDDGYPSAVPRVQRFRFMSLTNLLDADAEFG
jgi:hypothetical protein